MTLQPSNEEMLQHLCPSVAIAVRAVAATLANHHTRIRVVRGFRTAAQQEALYAQGRSQPGLIVTNARAGESLHNYGLAVDVVPFLTKDEDELNWSVSTPQYNTMVATLAQNGLAWGGDWKNLPDGDHFQPRGLPTTPSDAMREDYSAGNGDPASLERIWARVSAGDYHS